MESAEIWQCTRDIALRPQVKIERDEDALSIADQMTGWQLIIEAMPSRAHLENFLRDAALTAEHDNVEQIHAKQRRLRKRLQHSERSLALAELLDFVVEHVPHYRERAEIYSPGQVCQNNDYRALLAHLPLLGKQDVRLHFERFLADTVDVGTGLARNALEMTATSGTTSERVQVIADLELNALPDDYESIWAIDNVPDMPRTAIFTSPTCMGRDCHLGASSMAERMRGEHTLFLDSTRDLFSIRAPLIEQIAHELEEFSPDFLFVNPIYLHWLALAAERHGIALKSPRLIVSSYQYMSQCQKQALEQLFAVPVMSFYAATEFGGARQGIQCHRGQLHVREDQSIIEIVQNNTNLGYGNLGSVVVTPHANRTFPIIRGVVGDVGRLLDSECSCPIAHWDVLELHGRSKDMLRVADTWVTNKQIDDAIADTPGLAFYQLIQHSRDRAVLSVIPAPGVSLRPDDVGERLQARTGLCAEVRTVRRLDPAPSLKFPQTQCRFLEPPVLL